MQVVSNTVQLIGAAMTFYGVGSAYARARHGISFWRWTWRLLRKWCAAVLSVFRRRARPTGGLTISPPSFNASAVGHAPVVTVTVSLDDSLTIEERLNQLLGHVNELRATVARHEGDLTGLHRDIGQARDYATALFGQARADNSRALEKFDLELRRIQASDLQWVLGGAAVTVVGYLLAYCA